MKEWLDSGGVWFVVIAVLLGFMLIIGSLIPESVESKRQHEYNMCLIDALDRARRPNYDEYAKMKHDCAWWADQVAEKYKNGWK